MMKKLLTHTGIVLPLLSDNIDTDQIIPSREMKKVSKLGLGEGLFSGQRYLYDGKEKIGKNPNFILNQTPYDQASILLSNKNFGCGSSREHAVWALSEYGFRVIIAESFGNIFRNNCIRNGLLPITLLADQINTIYRQTKVNPNNFRLQVNLVNRQVIAASGEIFHFELEDYSQQMLINGWDFIDLAMQYSAQIDNFKVTDRKQRGWAYL